MPSRPARHDDGLVALHLVALSSLVVALAGTYWDDAWHTDVGRDSFFSPPHILLYAGIGIAGASIGLRALLHVRATRDPRSIVRERGLLLSLVGAGTTLASAPIDEAWHILYGRDAVAWSPPHLLGLVGVLLLAGGIHLDLRRAQGRFGAVARALASAAILAVLLALVFEYDSDVPQFDEMWYLPVLTLALALSFSLIQEDRGFTATRAATIYTVLMALTIAFLALLHHSTPILPLVIVPAIADDLARRKRVTLPYRVVILVLATFLAYQPYLHTLSGVQPDAMDTLLGLPLAAVGATLAYLGATTRRPSPKVLAPVALVLLASLAPSALAHDPGQGDPVHDVRLTAEKREDAWLVRATLVDDACDELKPTGLVARRAGREAHAELAASTNCSYWGHITLPGEGRWFVYTQLHDARGSLEAWIPVEPDGEYAEKRTQLYRPPETRTNPLQVASGALLYAASLGLVGFLLHQHRRAEASP